MEKKVFKFITVDNFEKEEQFLRDMSLEGWHFTHYEGLNYYFEKGTPKDFYYRIDYHSPNEGDKEDYLQLFEDSGWTTVFSYPIFDGEWCYFKKEAKENENLEIFTDSDSKIELFQKIRSKWGYFGLILTVLFLPLFLFVFSLDRPFDLLLFSVSLGTIVILYSKMVLNLTRKIQQLKK